MLTVSKFPTTLFDEFFGFGSDNPEMMKCDVTETKDNFHFEFDLPGIPKENIDLSVEGYDLTVTAKREAKKKEGVLIRSEKSWGSFKRSYTLPQRSVQMDAIQAAYENGVLQVTVPKSAAVKPTKISIQSGTEGVAKLSATG